MATGTGQSSDARPRVTDLLAAWNAGDKSALDQLTPLVIEELRHIARSHMRLERSGHVLQTTALINEAYMRLVDLDRIQWQDRTHFVAMASRLMRRVLIDYARANLSLKRGGGSARVTLSEDSLASESDPDLVALDDALTALAELDPRKSRVVELRFFGGLSVEETAHTLSVSTQTVMRDWALAKVWLLREITRER